MRRYFPGDVLDSPARRRLRDPDAPGGRGAAAVALAVTGVLLTGLAAYVDTLTTAAERDVVHAGRGALTAVTGTVLMVSAAVILRSRPRHRVGVVLAVFGLVWAVDGLLESWSALAFAERPPRGRRRRSGSWPASARSCCSGCRCCWCSTPRAA